MTSASPASDVAPAPEPLPTPRGVHLEMVGAVLAGEGLGRVAEIAAAHAGAGVALIVPRVGPAPEPWREYERYVAGRLAGGRVERPADVTAEAPVASGGRDFGAALLLGAGRADAGEYLQAAAAAALTELAAAEAREDAERRLGGSLMEELRRGLLVDGEEVTARAARLGCDLSGGAVALCADPGERAPGRMLAAIAADGCGAIAQESGGRVFAIAPGSDAARRLATRLGRSGPVGCSSLYSDPAQLGRAIEEAELVLGVIMAGGGPPREMLGDSTYRLLFRVMASHPQEVRSFFEDTIAPLVAYDEQYRTELVGTVDAYLENDCNMAAAAQVIHAHRHTVAYRLDRVRELTGLNPLRSEDRERLGLGLKAYRIIQPDLPR